MSVYPFSDAMSNDNPPYYMSQEWLDLLYYEKSGQNAYTSLADADTFFVTKSGKTDPKKEFEESLQLVKQQDVVFRKMFPLRYKRIATAFHIPYNPLVTVDPKFTSIDVAFPNRYMQNPASMFGHIFLVLNSKNGQLDSDIVHFLANTNGTAAYAYLFNGITGGFKGWYLQEPFYSKIKEYSYEEDREIIYYSLPMSPQNIEDIQLHLKELQHTHFDYYFLDENCAYFIAKFLNNFIDTLSFKRHLLVYPSLVIDALIDKHLLTDQRSRTPLVKQFKTLYHQLSPQERQHVADLLFHKQNNAPYSKKTLRTFLTISDYFINNYPSLSSTIRHNRLLSFKQLQSMGGGMTPESKQSPSALRIKSSAIGLQVGAVANTPIYKVSYSPIRYGFEEQAKDLDIKYIDTFSTHIVLNQVRPPHFGLNLVEIISQVQFNELLDSDSWKLDSYMGYDTGFKFDQSLQFGQSFQLANKTSIYGYWGGHISNYSAKLNRAYKHTYAMPFITLGWKYLPNVEPWVGSLTANIHYKYNAFIWNIGATAHVLHAAHRLDLHLDTFEGHSDVVATYSIDWAI